MKKIFYIAIAAFAAMAMASCQKVEAGATEGVEMAGQWYVTVDAAYDDPAEELWEDPFDLGRVIIVTSNTAANKNTEMFINDLGNVWDFSVKVNCDPVAKTFSVSEGDNWSYDCKVTVIDGKIVENGATTPSGMPADYIEFYVIFDDDDYLADGYYDKLKISGWRYTGFANDD